MVGAFIDVVFFMLPLTRNKCSPLHYLWVLQMRWQMASQHQTQHIITAAYYHSKIKGIDGRSFLSGRTDQTSKWYTTTRIWGVGLYIKLDIRLRVKSAMQFLKLFYLSKLYRLLKEVNITNIFLFIQNFSMLRTLTLICGSHQSLDKWDFSILAYAKTNF